MQMQLWITQTSLMNKTDRFVYLKFNIKTDKKMATTIHNCSSQRVEIRNNNTGHNAEECLIPLLDNKNTT